MTNILGGLKISLSERDLDYLISLLKNRIKDIEPHLIEIEKDLLIHYLEELILKLRYLPTSIDSAPPKQIHGSNPIEDQSNSSEFNSLSKLDQDNSKNPIPNDISSETALNSTKKARILKINEKNDIPDEYVQDLPEDIRVVCEKCDKYMDLFKSLKEEYYRCRNFPRCKITGTKNHVHLAPSQKLITQIISSDTIKMYRYDEEEKVVFVSEVMKEKGLLNSIDEGVWR